jgi:hypothetical protein
MGSLVSFGFLHCGGPEMRLNIMTGCIWWTKQLTAWGIRSSERKTRGIGITCILQE